MHDTSVCRIRSDGTVTFGVKEVKGKLIVSVPQFDLTGHKQKTKDQFLKTVNEKIQLRQETDAEKKLKKTLKMCFGIRAILEDNRLIPLDQETAKNMIAMGVMPMDEYKYFSIN